jgi:hypothetical protein
MHFVFEPTSTTDVDTTIIAIWLPNPDESFPLTEQEAMAYEHAGEMVAWNINNPLRLSIPGQAIHGQNPKLYVRARSVGESLRGYDAGAFAFAVLGGAIDVNYGRLFVEYDITFYQAKINTERPDPANITKFRSTDVQPAVTGSPGVPMRYNEMESHCEGVEPVSDGTTTDTIILGPGCWRINAGTQLKLNPPDRTSFAGEAVEMVSEIIVDAATAESSAITVPVASNVGGWGGVAQFASNVVDTVIAIAEGEQSVVQVLGGVVADTIGLPLGLAESFLEITQLTEAAEVLWPMLALLGDEDRPAPRHSKRGLMTWKIGKTRYTPNTLPESLKNRIRRPSESKGPDPLHRLGDPTPKRPNLKRGVSVLPAAPVVKLSTGPFNGVYLRYDKPRTDSPYETLAHVPLGYHVGLWAPPGVKERSLHVSEEAFTGSLALTLKNREALSEEYGTPALRPTTQ